MSSLINTKPELYLGWAYDRVEETDKANPYIDKIGGKPIWLNQNCPPPTNYATCDNCGERLFLLMQLQGHINKRKYDRVFYVWGCNNSHCMGKKGSFKVLRAHKGTHFKKHAKIIKNLNKPTEIPTNTIEKENENEVNTPPVTSQSSLTSENNIPLKPSIDINPVVIDPKEYEKEIDEIKEMNNNDNGLEFGFGNVTDFSWDTPGFGDANNDDWGTFGADDTNGFGFGDSSGFGDTSGFGNTSNGFGNSGGFGNTSNGFGNSGGFGESGNANDADDMDDLNKLLELRNKRYKEEEDEDSDDDNNTKQQKQQKQQPEKKEEETIENDKKEEIIQNEQVAIEEENPVNSEEDKEEEESAEEKEELEKAKQYWNEGRFFPDYYLDIELDPSTGKEDDYSHEKKLIEEYEKQNKLKGKDSSEMNWGDEKYEKTDNKYYNKVFRKFNEVVQEEPEQCLRYCIKGEPLFYDNDEISKKFSNPKSIPKCEKCGAMRTFEFQLMPNMLSVLPTEKFVNHKGHSLKNNVRNMKDMSNISRSDLINQFDTGMEWGTILVFTCSKDCDMDELQSKEVEEDGMWREDVSYYEELPVIEMESLF